MGVLGRGGADCLDCRGRSGIKVELTSCSERGMLTS